MHPVIRIVCFLLFTAFISQANYGQLLFATGLIIGLLILHPQGWLQRAFSMVLRLRWFLLSIVLVYGWLTPDVIHSQQTSSWLPSSQGVQFGLLRVYALVLIVTAVAYLLTMTSREQLLAAIYWLCAPLALIGVDRERLVVRLMLSLEYVSRLQQQLTHQVDKMQPQANFSARIKQVGYVAGSLFNFTLEQANTTGEESVVFDTLSPPAIVQWGYPLLLASGFLLVSYVAG